MKILEEFLKAAVTSEMILTKEQIEVVVRGSFTMDDLKEAARKAGWVVSLIQPDVYQFVRWQRCT